MAHEQADRRRARDQREDRRSASREHPQEARPARPRRAHAIRDPQRPRGGLRIGAASPTTVAAPPPGGPAPRSMQQKSGRTAEEASACPAANGRLPPRLSDGSRERGPRTGVLQPTDTRSTPEHTAVEFAVSALERTPSPPWVTVEGELDLTSSPRFKEALDEILEREPSELVVDLSAVTFIDSSALRVLINARARMPAGTRLPLVCTNRNVLRIFKITGRRSQLRDLRDARAGALAGGPQRTLAVLTRRVAGAGHGMSAPAAELARTRGRSSAAGAALLVALLACASPSRAGALSLPTIALPTLALTAPPVSTPPGSRFRRSPPRSRRCPRSPCRP